MPSTRNAISSSIGSVAKGEHHWVAYALGFSATLIALANGAVALRMYSKLSDDTGKQTELKNDMVFSAVSVSVSGIVLILLGVGIAKKW